MHDDDLDELLRHPEELLKRGSKLDAHWRSLLDGDESDAETSQRSSFLFQPRGGLGLDPSLDPSTFVRRAGDTLADFELTRLIAQGGMGQVWEARQNSLERTVALKLIRPDRMTPDILRFFRREGRAGGRLQHPGIVGVYAMGESEGVHWIAQEFIDGECTLASFLQDRSPEDLPRDYDRRIALFFFQVAEALQFAHEANVIHRDLKPQNVLIASGDRPKVTDFGLARIEDEGSLSEQGALQGTPRYMSPEQALGLTDAIGRHSDVFSLGAMLYQALTLEFPFQGDSLPAVLDAVVNADPVAPRKLRDDMSSDLEAIVMQALEKRPKDRYASMQAFASDLASYLDGRAPLARPAGLAKRTIKWLRRHPVAVSVAGAVAVLAVVVVLLLGALDTSQDQARMERWRNLTGEARRHVERGDLAAAQAALDDADRVLPGRPDTALILAGAVARRTRYREAERHLAEAERWGYNPDSVDRTSARELYLEGLFHFARGRLPAYEKAAASFEQALALDTEFVDAWYPLYQIRTALDDYDGAVEALEQFKRGLTFGDPQSRLVEALIHESRGEAARARDVLLELQDDPALDERVLHQISAYRVLGRVLLMTRDFAGAQRALEIATESYPDDFDSQNNLGLALLGRVGSEALPTDEVLGLLDAASEAARRALEHETKKRTSLQVAAYADMYRARHGAQGTGAIDTLRSYDPDDAALASIDAAPRFVSANALWQQGRFGEALAEYDAGLAIQPNAFLPLVRAGYQHYFEGTPESNGIALEYLDRAHELRTEPRAGWTVLGRASHVEDPHLTQMLYVARSITAARLGETEVSAASCEALEYDLETRPFVSYADQLTYAEFLATVDDLTLADTDRAYELFEDYLERSGVSIGEWPVEYDSTVQAILNATEGG